ncbi:modifier of mdg4-like isoform X6 [Drosophila navojoa]|uniref:modifier of mdg4-like isoform X6 n=1 Tax=Drosophila navojoa TaxID=7232 RepID=UPI00084696C6|nr:modifier of mdg4-like isoform X6 [Drosophila navojoa]
MADDEQFSLCWNNFNTNLSAGFHESLCRGDLVDVSLAAEGQIVKAHRLVLSVCSPFFRKMFTQMPSNTHAIVFLNNVSHSALKDLIQFMYCGEVNVKQDALPAFISTAESLQIKGLTDNDPAPQPPQEPTPPPAAPHVQQQQQIPAQRVQRQQPRTSARYKIETVDDVLGDDKATTQIVIQTTAAPQATIVQQPQQQQQHIQTQQLQTGTTTTATLVSTNKRAAQRGSLIGSGAVKRSKTSSTTSTAAGNVIDPLESTTDTSANAPTSTQQMGTQQITVQTTVVAADTKVHQVRQQQQQQQQQQQAAAQEEAEYIDLPMELPTKSEPDYSEEHAEVAGDGDTPYVEDDAYGDMRYDDSYFTENEDAGNQTGGNTGTSIAATTSKAVVKQQSQSYSDSSFVDTGADQGNTEAQVDVKVELSSEASATPTPVLETDACVAAFAAAYLSDDDTMAIRKPYTLPKILDGKFYKNIQPNQKTPGAIQATCTSCFGLISGTTKSTGNFLSHIKRRHKELLPLCQLYCQAKSNVSGSGSLNTKPAIHNAMSSAIEQQQPPPPPVPQAYATSTAHLSVPMPLAMPLSMPVTVQAPQMMALMHHQHHRQQPGAALPQLQAINPGHGAVYISKEY